MEACCSFAPIGKLYGRSFNLAAPLSPILRFQRDRCARRIILAFDRAGRSIPNSRFKIAAAEEVFHGDFAGSKQATDDDEVISEEMRKEAEDSLEWRLICSQVAAFASTSMSRDLCVATGLPIGRDERESQKLLDQTAAAVQLPRPLDFSGLDDISSIVASAVSSKVLSIGELCAVERNLRSARGIYQQLTDLSSNRCSSSLLLLFQDCNFLEDLVHRIESCIDCNLSIVKDQASEKLQTIRVDRRKNAENLELLLKATSNRIFQAGGIDSPLITRRRSRMCVGIRASHKSLLPDGIVLGVSSSGATYFMEPREAVELNNMEVRLSSSERAEELAILILLSSEIASLEREIRCLMDIILMVDLATARASHARWMGSSCPAFSNDSLLVNIEGFCHPLLLERSLKKVNNSSSVTNVVPVDMKIRKGSRVVVISGPNTGGKTATMKSLGLASLMAKAGMFLPAKSTPSLPWFDQVLVDIGDHQSLEQNLSTFSGHISRIRKILRIASPESLVLLDEIGSGTDPSEGVALAASILQQLRNCAALTVVTTHYADLSLLTLEDDGFENAAMEFCLKSLQPTYRVLWGSAGISNALTIAKAVGFDQRVVDRAREWVEILLPDKQRERQGLLFQSLSKERDVLEADARKAENLLNQVKGLYHEIHSEAKDLEKREAALKAKEVQRTLEEVKLVRGKLDAIVVDFEKQLQRATTRDQGAAIFRRSEASIARIVNAYASPADDDESSDTDTTGPTSLRIGDRVLVNSLGGREATVVDSDVDGFLVQYGKMRVRVKARDLRLSQTATPAATRAARGERRNKGEEREAEGAMVYGAAVQTRNNTVDLRGLRAEEAAMQLAAAVAGCRSYGVLFVVHGVGTGAVKEAALSVLRSHPRVTRFEPESSTNDGCTVAYVK
ncbi:DNA mismatch repair protein MutS, type 2 isoform X2 [Wolffia australiana]